MKIKKIAEKKPEVAFMELKATRFQDGQRKDIWFEGKVWINREEYPLSVHLFSSDGSIPENKNKFYFCGVLGVEHRDYDNFDDCPYCTGNHGVAGSQTQGLVAVALGEALQNDCMVGNAKLGLIYDLATWLNPGGWWTFRHEVPVKPTSFEGKAPRFSHPKYAEIVDFNCPIHKQFYWQKINDL